MKFNNITAVLILIPLLFIQFCNDHSTSPPQTYDFKYPLNIGNEWKYKDSIRYENIQPDSIKYMFTDFSYEYKIVINKDTILNSHYMVEWERITPEPYPVHYEYYANEENGLINYGYRDMFESNMSKSGNVRFSFEGNYYASILDLVRNFERNRRTFKTETDSIILFDPPRIIYPYPLNLGSHWQDEYMPNSTKEVVGQVIIATPVGQYLCYKIQWNYLNDDGSKNDNYKIYEYICQKGLVKKVVELKNITVSTMEYPDGIGTADVLEEIVVEDINF